MSPPGKETRRGSNRLAGQKSPYLLQHALNPVDWWPWGEEAFTRAREEDKPIFLSIGYGTCHWCHVMAHESFEDEEVARLLNQSFVAIKVDREERPDVDKIYMYVCQALTGQGGWPLSLFLTPDAKPFFAGTYFPKSSRMGMAGFMDILKAISDLWKKDRTRLLETSNNIVEAINKGSPSVGKASVLDMRVLEKGYSRLVDIFDRKWGGFGSAPKFPAPHQLFFLLRWSCRKPDSEAQDMVEKTLKAMRNGGIFDQMGFGFHRYSVDEQWLVPHFEKMLYDQALLSIAYTEAYQFTGNMEFEDVSREIFSYVLREMTSAEGGFYCAEDADSEGREGLFYLWARRDVEELLGKERAELFCDYYDIRSEGNFEEGLNIPNIPEPLNDFAQAAGIDADEFKRDLEESRHLLMKVRDRRIRPLKDDKILTSWNGLMIAAFSIGFQVFGDDEYYRAAVGASEFILGNLQTDRGGLLRRYRKGEAAYTAYLDDYAFLVWGLIELYEAGFEVKYLEKAVELNRTMLDFFRDEKNGGFYFTGEGNEPLITRTKDIYDGALPSGNSVAALNLLRLARITGASDLEVVSEELFSAFAKEIVAQPIAYTQLLTALDFKMGPGIEIVIAGDPSDTMTRKMINTVREDYLQSRCILVLPDGSDAERVAMLAPYAKEMRRIEGKSVAYVCKNFSCLTPVEDEFELKRILENASD